MDANETWDALEHGAVTAPGGVDVVEVRGPDARAFVHRLSTADVGGAEPGAGALNLFADKKGRVRFVAHQVTRAADRVWLLVDEGHGAALAAWLDGFHFAEQIDIAPLGAGVSAARVIGAAAARAVEALTGAPRAPFAAVTRDDVISVRTFDHRGRGGAAIPAFLVVTARAKSLALPPPGDARAIAQSAIAAGIVEGSVDEGFAGNPLELGLVFAVSFDKGCFTGQEVIARTENLGKQSRHAASLVVDGEAARGDVVRSGDREVGVVVRGAPSTAPVANALALVRIGDVADRDTLVVVHGGATWPARMVETFDGRGARATDG